MEHKKYKPRKRIAKVIFAGKRSVKQRVWDYMRRNKIFKIKDLMCILDVKEYTIRYIIYALETAGYVQRKKRDDKKQRQVLMEATFVFLAKDNILIAPIITSNEVYCTTTGVKTDIGARKLLLNALKNGLGQNEVARKIGVDRSTMSLLVNNKYPNPHLLYKKVRANL